MKAKTQSHIFRLESDSEAKTIEAGQSLASLLKPGDILFLIGELGAGKTVFVKGLAKGLGVKPQAVKSPTFVLLHEYPGRLPLYHFDLYRLGKESEWGDLDLDAFFYRQGVSVVEWAEKIKQSRPAEYLEIRFLHRGPNCRAILLRPHGDWYAGMCQKLKVKFSPPLMGGDRGG